MKSYLSIFSFAMLFLAISFTVSYAQIKWTKHPAPVLTPGPAGEWDEEFVGIPCVLFDGSTYHMWYSNYNYITGNHEKIGYAISTNGIMWTKYDNPTTTNPPYAESDPVLLPGSPGTYDDEWLSFPSVLLINSIYHMWYGASDDPAFAGHISICYATSPDGISWTKNPNNPVLDVGPNGTWDDVWLCGPCVVFDGSMYHMWYHAWDGFGPPDRVRIGHATSPDPGGPWTKDPDNPVLDIGSSGSWDYDRVDAPSVIYDGSRFHMLYSGGMFTAWRIGYAWSDNGSNWTKYDDSTTTNPPYAESDPVLTWGPAGTFDDINVSHCSVILDSTLDIFKMWYIAGDSVYDNHYSCQIGYATAPISYEAIFEYTFISEDSVKFTDKSIGIITDWLWDFGDGDTSTARNPVHIYNQSGEYTITLTVSGPYGFDSSSEIIVGIDEEIEIILKDYCLRQNYPNPFNPKTVIDYSVGAIHESPAHIELSIYNILGQKVATLVDKKQQAGNYSVEWDASGFPSGVYYYRITAGDFQQVKKMILMK